MGYGKRLSVVANGSQRTRVCPRQQLLSGDYRVVDHIIHIAVTSCCGDAMNQKIYRYVVQYDGGSAPRPYGHICTLAICKPGIRKGATVGDWIIGVRSCAHDKIVYVMQVAQSMSLSEYWCDARFHERKAGSSPVPDNIYQPGINGNLEQVDNNVHNAGNKEADISGVNALIGERFWYFGKNSPRLPEDLEHLKPYPRSYTVHKNRRTDDIKNLERWLTTWSCGLHGEPINASSETLEWIAKEETGEKQYPVNKNAEYIRIVTDAVPNSSVSTTGCRR